MCTGETILLKKGWRRDSIWTRPWVYRSFLKLVPLFFDTWALMKSQYWPREMLEKLRDDRLNELLSDARCIPFWRKVLDEANIDSALTPLQKLDRLPIISKRELVINSVENIADQSLVEKSDPDHTSGSTGKPFNFYQDWHASLRSFAVTERIFRSTKKSRWPIGKRAPIVYMRARERNGFTFYRHVWFFCRAFSSVQHRMEDFAALGKKLRRGFILYGYTSWIVELARQMEKRNIQAPVRTVMVAGEHLTDQDRAYIEKIMKAELFTLYASREAGFLGYECEHHKMHISEEWAYLEIVNENGDRLPPGKEGRIIVTTFDNRIMPFIRYDIGDVGIISDVPCVCGRTLRTLEFKGRTSELIELEGGRVVSLLDIAYSIGHFKDTIRHYQIIQTSNISFTFKVVPGAFFDHVKEELELLMIRLLHPRVRLTWEIVESIPEAKSGKAVYFVRDFKGQS